VLLRRRLEYPPVAPISPSWQVESHKESNDQKYCNA
jgi:hypothetical protein